MVLNCVVCSVEKSLKFWYTTNLRENVANMKHLAIWLYTNPGINDATEHGRINEEVTFISSHAPQLTT